MIDHIGLAVGDMDRAKAFYLSALKPLGLGVIMEVTRGGDGRLTRTPVSANDESLSSGSARARSPRAERMWPSRRKRTPRSMRSTAPRWRRAAATMARRVRGPTTTSTITAPSSSIPTATTSRPCVISRDSEREGLAGFPYPIGCGACSCAARSTCRAMRRLGKPVANSTCRCAAACRPHFSECSRQLGSGGVAPKGGAGEPAKATGSPNSCPWRLTPRASLPGRLSGSRRGALAGRLWRPSLRG